MELLLLGASGDLQGEVPEGIHAGTAQFKPNDNVTRSLMAYSKAFAAGN